jgi:hypothetical protein
MMKFFRATEDTKFHIDYSWFDTQGQDVNVLIWKCLNDAQRERLGDHRGGESIDFINADTGEIEPADAVLQMLRSESARDPMFITAKTPVFEAAFRIFLINNNAPMTARELAARMGRKPQDVLAQIGGRVAYNGIRPIVPA